MSKEAQNAASRRSLLNLKSDKRMSMSSSSSSIQNIGPTLDFDQAIGGVDDLISKMQSTITAADRDSSGPNGTSASRTSLHNSVSDIYIKAIADKREAMQKASHAKPKLRTQISNLSSGTSASSSRASTPAKVKQHRSTGALNVATPVAVNTDPRGTALSQSRTDSVNTLESEKSCY